MKLTFTADANIQVATEDGLTTYAFAAGDTADVPEDVAALFLNGGWAEPAKATRAAKTAGETATK